MMYVPVLGFKWGMSDVIVLGLIWLIHRWIDWIDFLDEELISYSFHVISFHCHGMSFHVMFMFISCSFISFNILCVSHVCLLSCHFQFSFCLSLFDWLVGWLLDEWFGLSSCFNAWVMHWFWKDWVSSSFSARCISLSWTVQEVLLKHVLNGCHPPRTLDVRMPKRFTKMGVWKLHKAMPRKYTLEQLEKQMKVLIKSVWC